MSEVTAGSFTLYYNGVKAKHFTREKWEGKLKKAEWRCHGVVKNQMTVKPTTYSSRISTDIPLFESPGASFDQYLEDKPRVFKAIFPDKRRSHQLNEEEWRIQMLPINFLFLTVWPTVDMRLRCKSGGRDYPPQVPSDITKVLQLDIIKWELRGLNDVLEPAHFVLGVKGALYPDRRGARSRLKGQLEMNISFVLPPVLALIPEDVRTKRCRVGVNTIGGEHEGLKLMAICLQIMVSSRGRDLKTCRFELHGCLGQRNPD